MSPDSGGIYACFISTLCWRVANPTGKNNCLRGVIWSYREMFFRSRMFSSQEPAQPRSESFPGASPSQEPAHPRSQPVPGASPFREPAHPRSQPVPGGSPSQEPARPRRDPFPGASPSQEPAHPRSQPVPGASPSQEPAHPRSEGSESMAAASGARRVVALVSNIPSRPDC